MARKKLTVDEINVALKQAALRDAEGVVEDPGPIEFELGDTDVEGWEEYVTSVVDAGPPEDPEEEV